MSTFKQMMKTKEAWQKAYDREVSLRYKLANLEKDYDLPRGEARIEEYDGKTYVVTVDTSSYQSSKLIITEVAK